MIEKPVCPTVAEARDLVALANSKGLLLSVYQNRRWDSDFLTVKKLVESEQVRSLRRKQNIPWVFADGYSLARSMSSPLRTTDTALSRPPSRRLPGRRPLASTTT